MKRVRVTRDAERDLDEIWLYIAHNNVCAANRLVDELTNRFALIGSSPAMGRNADELIQDVLIRYSVCARLMSPHTQASARVPTRHAESVRHKDRR